jgi:hypothetical protein
MIRRLLLAALMLLFVTPAIAGDANGPVHVSAGTVVDLGVINS